MTLVSDTLTQADKQEILAECRAIHALLCKVLEAVDKADRRYMPPLYQWATVSVKADGEPGTWGWQVYLNDHPIDTSWDSREQAETAAADLRTELLR